MATGSAINLFGSVVHDATPPVAAAINLYASVVHDATPPAAAGINLFSSVVHDTIQISGTVADITGTVGNPATFDGTPMGLSTGSVNYQWSWQSVPGGSAIANASFPLPDNGSTTPVNMFGNVGLWHFESSASITPFPNSQSATPIDMTNNVALWHFEGNANDSSGEGNNLTEFGTPGYVTGKVESQAIDFNGSTQYAHDTISSPPTTDGSWSGWFKFNSFNGGYNMIAGFGPVGVGTGEYRSLMYTGGNLFFWGYYNDFLITTTSISAGVWFHVALTWQTTTDVKVYLNGAEVYSATMGGLIAPSDQFWIAKRPDTTQFSDMEADEIAIWSRVLSGGEIRDIFDKQYGGFADTSGEGNSLVKVGDPALIAGKVGTYAADFNGTTDGLFSSLSNPPTTDGTIAGWVNLDETNNDKLIFGFGPPAVSHRTWRALFVDNSGILRFVGIWADFTTSATLSTGIWYHLAVTWENIDASNDDVAVYVDGAKIHSQTLNLDTPQTSFNIAYRADGPYWTNMAADGIATWNRPLSALEIDQIYFFQSGSCASGSVGLGQTFTFTPDVSGIYSIELGLTDGASMPISGNVNAVISSGGGPGVTGTGSIEGVVWELTSETTGASVIEGNVWELSTETAGESRNEGVVWELSAEPLDKPSLNIPDITSISGASSCFYATASYTETGSIAYVWEWVSIPGGSLITSGSRTGFSGSGGAYSEVPTGSTACYLPDITGSYIVKGTFYSDTGSGGGSFAFDTATGVVSDPPAPPGPIITSSNPSTVLVEADDTSSGYVFNTNKIDLLSVQRSRTIEQVPFIFGTKSKQTLRLRTNQEFTGSS